jgi:YD repeat-containing protein
MKIKIYLFTVLVTVGLTLKLSAQVSYNKRAMGSIGNAPNAGNFLNGASLDNVDMSTGTLKVGIPLYEIKANDISVPITLNYSATGLKVGQEASVVGMGWELSAGGKVITNVQGRPDNTAPNGINSDLTGNPYPFYYEGTSSTNIDTKGKLHDIIDGKRDNAWDTYNYILPHGGGSFVTDGTTSITVPYDPMVKIESVYKLKTSDGLEYNFTAGDTRKTTRIINYPSTFTPAYTSIVDPNPKTWSDYDLLSIKSTRFNDVVNFKYTQMAGYEYINRIVPKKRTNTSESLPLYRDVQEGSLTANGMYPDPYDESYNVMEPLISKSETEYLTHTRLDTIDFPTGKVLFFYTIGDVLGRDVLTHIKIYKKENNTLKLVKRYLFEYYVENFAYGHYLKDIKIYNSKEEFQDRWVFTYVDGYLPVVPGSESKAQDRWGFYNGATGNKTLLEDPESNLNLKMFAHYPVVGLIKYKRNENIGYYGGETSVWTTPSTYEARVFGNSYFTVAYANREWSFNNAIKGSLSTVRTPSGALYQYVYEGHFTRIPVYDGTSSPGYIPVYGGGLRVQSITKNRYHVAYYTGASDYETVVDKTYNYGDADPDDENPEKEYSNKGQTTIPFNVLKNLSVYTEPGNASHFIYVSNMMLVSHPINNLVQYGGSYCMYKSITETLNETQNSTVSHGKTVYFNHLPLFDPYDSDGFGGPYPSGGRANPYNLYFDDPGVVGAPFMNKDAGLPAETGAGIFAIYKYAYASTGVFKLAQKTKYDFKFYQAPESSSHLRSIYATITGQLSGVAPTIAGMPQSFNLPVEQLSAHDRGTSVTNAFTYTNLTSTNSDGATMDYITKSYLVDQANMPEYPGKYELAMHDLNNFSYCMRKTKETVSDCSRDGYVATETITDYDYENQQHMLPTTITRTPTKKIVIGNTNPVTDATVTKLYYEQDLPGVANTLRNVMKSSRMGLNEPIREDVYSKRGVSQVETLMSTTINTFKLDGVYGNAVVPYKVFKAVNPDNVATLPTFDYWGNLGIAPDPKYYRQQISYDLYDKGQVHQYTTLTGKSEVVLWGYNNQYPTAKVTNVGNIDYSTYTSADVAYTSFETRDTCNWLYAGTIVADESSVSGKNVYQLGTGTITKVNATAAGKYIVSYWYKTGSTVTITGGAVGAAIVKNTVGPWTHAEQEISSVTGVVTVDGTGYIDELRFHPKDAQMSTYLYDPMIGLTCTIDANGRPQYYEYDELQRLKQIRDNKGNIVKAYKYILGSSIF